MSSTKSEPASARPTRPWPADRVERRPIDELIPYANNPRLHSEADIDKIADAILKWGWTMPPLVDEELNCGSCTEVCTHDVLGRLRMRGGTTNSP